VLLLVRERTGSYALAGVAVGVLSAAAGAAAPVLGRLVDRRGQTRVVVPVGLAGGAALGALALAGWARAPVGLLLALAALAGATVTPVSACLRALWRDALPPGVAPDTAYSLESTSQELIFILGPLLAAGILAVSGPEAVLAAGAALGTAGALAFASRPPSRSWRPAPRGGRGRGALAHAGVRTLTFGAAALLATFAFVEVVVVAFATERGARASAGIVLAVWAAASMVGGLWHGALAWRRPLRQRALAFAVLVAAGFAPLAAARSTTVLGVLIVAAGVFIAPLMACIYALLGELAPAGTLTEAFSWLNAAFVTGAAVGAAAAGVAVDGVGTRGALGLLVAVAALCPALLVARRRTLEPAPLSAAGGTRPAAATPPGPG
jgi:MFS family permease